MSFDCKRCGYDAKTLGNLKRHYHNKTPCKALKADISLNALLYDINSKKTYNYNCTICNKGFSSRQSLYVHKKNHHNTNKKITTGINTIINDKNKEITTGINNKEINTIINDKNKEITTEINNKENNTIVINDKNKEINTIIDDKNKKEMNIIINNRINTIIDDKIKKEMNIIINNRINTIIDDKIKKELNNIIDYIDKKLCIIPPKKYIMEIYDLENIIY
jgi:hypothetical protein